ncbi:DUF3105 domain-containing protein [Catenuloplanes atrovinosus]|uniref:DUF3105 domain-containing protein n=1 Tax=Catenuloplanes atrovinosus TaxID=137266 RepID=A0AAE3YYP9_9ACTN|nr:DUF3105 domain-containing protein [Catenuloplanes atrovinosus]MDR7281026.1 hypothetical protein [Catenuloplanes atrovinosus]
MSISTQGGPERRPSVVKPAAGAKPNSPGGGKPKGSGARPGGGKGPRKPVTPVKVAQQRSWGPILLFVAVGALAVGIIGYGAFAVIKGSESWEDRAAGIDGIVNYRETDPGMLTANHKSGPQTYKTNPPVGGDHNTAWQNCMGDVYDAPIANEHAVHSMEHGAVWITYKTGLPQDQIDKLAEKVQGNEFMLMSPVDGLSNNISLQAWGYQLKVDTADDDRIDSFIRALRVNATQEPNAGCSSGVTATGTTPREISTGS